METVVGRGGRSAIPAMRIVRARCFEVNDENICRGLCVIDAVRSSALARRCERQWTDFMKSHTPSSRFLSIVLAAVIALLIPADHLRGQAANDADPFQRQVQAISLDHQTVFEAISRVHEATGVVVSVEKVLSTSEANQADQEFTTTITGGKPDVVLDEICALAGRYTWSRDGNMVNIYPRDVTGDPNYIFNRSLPVFSVQEVSDAPTAAIRAVRELPGSPEQLIILEAGNYDFARPWTAKFENVTLRRAINRIAEHLCNTCGWQLTGTKSTPTVIFYRSLQGSRSRN